MRQPRVAAVGQASWHHLLLVDRFPVPGGCAIVQGERPELGGTTSFSAVALARLGADVSFAGVVGDDEEGVALRDALEAEGIDTGWLAVRPDQGTETATVIVGGNPPGRTTLWQPGARIVRGDRLDIAALFDHDVVLLDVADAPLRRFLTDLPAHTLPRTRLVAPLHHLVHAGLSDALEVALRHDVLIGTERQVRSLAGADTLEAAVVAIQAQMRGGNLRSLITFLGPNGCTICTPSELWNIPGFPVPTVDTAADAFAAAVAYGIARRWSWPEAGRFANAVAALSTRDLPAQGVLPRLDEVVTFLERHPSDATP